MKTLIDPQQVCSNYGSQKSTHHVVESHKTGTETANIAKINWLSNHQLSADPETC
ncbi:hypothetical protein KIN20_004513 [Parelaphostrongylus tenuis]|uniref:Uncharacterized protein n=1 Tax=Parelaphostrongylus tenuis TaxID=148309 RepID=A0AAD5MK21_PARTN|nr:hypothetical protein KIN20_004513 [Parelaphostrongylus tenuis]